MVYLPDIRWLLIIMKIYRTVSLQLILPNRLLLTHWCLLNYHLCTERKYLKELSFHTPVMIYICIKSQYRKNQCVWMQIWPKITIKLEGWLRELISQILFSQDPQNILQDLLWIVCLHLSSRDFLFLFMKDICQCHCDILKRIHHIQANLQHWLCDFLHN